MRLVQIWYERCLYLVDLCRGFRLGNISWNHLTGRQTHTILLLFSTYFDNSIDDCLLLVGQQICALLIKHQAIFDNFVRVFGDFVGRGRLIFAGRNPGGHLFGWGLRNCICLFSLLTRVVHNQIVRRLPITVQENVLAAHIRRAWHF